MHVLITKEQVAYLKPNSRPDIKVVTQGPEAKGRQASWCNVPCSSAIRLRVSIQRTLCVCHWSCWLQSITTTVKYKKV
jgi:hypothetical protein